jgi:hypothetical protein
MQRASQQAHARRSSNTEEAGPWNTEQVVQGGKTLGRRLPRTFLRRLLDRHVYEPAKREKHVSLDDPPLFDSMFFEVRTRCNGRCSFCTASIDNDPRPDISMSMSLYETLLAELVNIGFKGGIAFHDDGAPPIFKNLVPFVSKARVMLPNRFIQILSNGRGLTLTICRGTDRNRYRRAFGERVQRRPVKQATLLTLREPSAVTPVGGRSHETRRTS